MFFLVTVVAKFAARILGQILDATDETQLILSLIKDMRRQGILAYATLDAGPNVKIITTKAQAPEIVAALHDHLPQLKLDVAVSGPGITYD